MRLTRVEISIPNLRENYLGVRARIGPGVKIMGIVKANAYGHGLVEISRALVEMGTDYLGVGFLEEGIALRSAGVRAPILVLGGVLGSQVAEFLENDLEITVSSIEIAERIEREVQKGNRRRARVHLKIDTGMERIGVHAENAGPFAERVCRLPHIDVVGVYSHLASSDERDKTFTLRQLDRFHSALDQIRARGISVPLAHIANSGAILDMPESSFGMVRPGIMLYGIYPSRETSESVPLMPVLAWKSHVVFLKEVRAGSPVSYGGKYLTPRATRLATVPVGYGDGYSRSLSGRAQVLVRGRRYPVVGAICMDQIMVDVGSEAEVHVGDEVTLVGSDGTETISAWEVAGRIDTIPYEVLSAVAARVPRVYKPV